MLDFVCIQILRYLPSAYHFYVCSAKQRGQFTSLNTTLNHVFDEASFKESHIRLGWEYLSKDLAFLLQSCQCSEAAWAYHLGII